MPTVPPKPIPHKNALDIRLAESIIFLRAGDATGRQRSIQADAPPSMVRGLLVLTLAKPTRITSIEVELVGKTNTAWPEGVGARRIEISEEHDVYSQSIVFFRAGDTPGSNARRNLSVGPGLSLEHEDEDSSEHSSYMQPEDAIDERRGRSPHPQEENQARPHRRHMSVDQTHFQRSFVAHHDNAQPAIASPPYSPMRSPNETPYHLSPSVSVAHRPPLTPFDESPARSLEDLRRALEVEQPTAGPAQSPGRSSSTIWSPREAADSRRVSYDEDRDAQLGSSVAYPQQAGPSQAFSRDGRTPSRQRDTEGDDTARGRKNKRFSFASALFEAMKDRVRSHSPLIERDHSRSGYTTPPRGRARDRPPSAGEYVNVVPKEPSALGRVGEALGLEIEDGREYGDGWKEFRKGTYTYPISFAIPANSPPSLQLEYGSVMWKLKAVVHRPGAFKTKLTASHDITVVITPDEDDTEESESIIVERPWDSQMQYLIVISGRSFTIGGTMPISLTFMPWTKMKIHRVSVIIDERVDYWTNFKRVARTDPYNRVSLLSLKYPKKDGPHILPLESDDPDAFRRSPLFQLCDSEDDIGEALSNFMGPGPWTIRKELRLPGPGQSLHTTNKNRRSNISVSHMLKIIFRVERGDDYAIDCHTGRRKLFDIVVQTPVHILSHLCNPEHTSLPPYSQLPPTSSSALASSSHTGPGVLSESEPIICQTSPQSAGPSENTLFQQQQQSASASALTHHSSIASSTSSRVVAAAPAPLLQRFTSEQSVESSATTSSSAEQHQHQHQHQQHQLQHPASPTTATAKTTIASPPMSRRQSLHEPSTPELFERLVAGQQTEEGEAPPSYEAALELESPSSTPSLVVTGS